MPYKITLYIFAFFGQFYPIYPLYGLMFSEVGNLSSNQIASLFFVWFVFALLWEIPTGVIADRFSRRDSVLLGYVMTVVTFALWLVCPTYWGFLLGFLLWGLGFALISGAWDAYLYTLCEQHDQSDYYTKHVGRLESIGYIGSLCAYLLAAVLIQFGYDMVLVVSVVIGIIAPLCLLFLPRDRRGQTAAKGQVQILLDAYRQVKASPRLTAIIFSIAVLGGFVGMIEEYVPLYFAWNGLSTQVAANVMFFALVVLSLVSWNIHRFEWMSLRQINLTIVVLGLVLFVSGWVGGLVAIVGLFVVAKVWYGLQTLQNVQLQHAIDGDERATVGSLATFQAEVLAVVFLSLYWLASNVVPEQVAVFGLGLVLAGVFGGYELLREKGKK